MSTQTQGQILKFVAVLMQNLPEISAKTMQDWIENPRVLQKFLAGLASSATMTLTEFRVWKTIKLRVGMTAEAYHQAIKNKVVGSRKMDICDKTIDYLSRPTFSVVTTDTELDLVILSVEELMGKGTFTLKEVFDRAKERGLKLCPNQVGPELRLQYQDQPMYGMNDLVIGMEPIVGSDEWPCLFSVIFRSDSVPSLSICNGHANNRAWTKERFVFVLPRQE